MRAPPPDTYLHRSLPHDASAPAKARAMVEEAGGGLAPSVVESAQLIVSELVTNSVQHTFPEPHGEIDVALRVRGDSLYGEVHDAGRTRDAAWGQAADVGFGLTFVDELASDHGTEVSAEGRTAWFEVRIGTTA